MHLSKLALAVVGKSVNDAQVNVVVVVVFGGGGVVSVPVSRSFSDSEAMVVSSLSSYKKE